MGSPKPYNFQIGHGGNGMRSKAELDWWKSVWKGRPVVVERPFFAESFNVNDFPQLNNVVSRLGWNQYLQRSGDFCNSSLSSLFMASLLPLDQPYCYQARVRGRTVTLNPTNVGQVIGVLPLPEGQFEFPHLELPANAPTHDQLATFLAGVDIAWPGTHEGIPAAFPRSQLRQDLLVLWLLVCNSLMPTTQHAHINLSHARAMHALVMQRPFCLPRFFIQQIASIIESTNRKDSIKMGILITRLCNMLEVPHHGVDELKRQLGPINITSLNRSRGQYRARVQDAPVEGEAAEEEAAEEEAEEGGAHQAETSTGRRQKRRAESGPVPLDMAALMGKLDDMHVMYQSQFTAAAENDQRFRDQYNQDIATLSAGFRVQNERYGAMNTRIGIMENRIGGIDDQLRGMNQELGTIRSDISTGFDTLEDQIRELMAQVSTPPRSPSPDL